MRRALLTGCLLLLVVGAFYLRRKPFSHELKAAPDFKLMQFDGPELELNSFRGKVVVVDFWATWCVPCREEIPHLVQLQQKYADRGLQIIGVSIDDSADPVRGFYKQFGMNYPVVMGTAKTGEDYGGVLGLPITFFIGRDGKIYAKKIGAQSAAVLEGEIQKLL